MLRVFRSFPLFGYLLAYLVGSCTVMVLSGCACTYIYIYSSRASYFTFCCYCFLSSLLFMYAFGFLCRFLKRDYESFCSKEEGGQRAELQLMCCVSQGAGDSRSEGVSQCCFCFCLLVYGHVTHCVRPVAPPLWCYQSRFLSLSRPSPLSLPPSLFLCFCRLRKPILYFFLSPISFSALPPESVSCAHLLLRKQNACTS